MSAKSKYLIGAGAGLLSIALVAGGTVYAKSIKTRPAAAGIVSAINGSTITLATKNGTTYSINAGSATIEKFTPGSSGTKGQQSTISISQIQVGDNIIVSGAVSGNNINATQIIDGVFAGRRNFMGMGKGISGTVATINGSTLTVNAKTGTTYAINAGSATITKIGTTTNSSGKTVLSKSPITVADIRTGDNIMAFGTVSGTSVTATQIVDGSMIHKNFGLGRKAGIGKTTKGKILQ